ncbi:hypothetical protein VTJ04DRAFT_10746 [Mycothermus thermophilus]|uniref:uncharacterized protein n=1 Tax=Humicola insolens TaxID=85995 RepID=UPI003742BBBA
MTLLPISLTTHPKQQLPYTTYLDFTRDTRPLLTTTNNNKPEKKKRKKHMPQNHTFIPAPPIIIPHVHVLYEEEENFRSPAEHHHHHHHHPQPAINKCSTPVVAILRSMNLSLPHHRYFP